jgi:superoxide dismutase, Fe-Mn family
MEKTMKKYELPKLPYSVDSFEGFLSPESFSYHYGKHHQSYINKLNDLIADTNYEKISLEGLITQSWENDKSLFNQAAQAWNHTFFWYSMAPNKTMPSAGMKSAIEKSFGSLAEFSKEWTVKGASQFGSGWVWLAADTKRNLTIETTSNAENPITNGLRPILCADVWEHAYYIDHRNARKKFLDAWTKQIDWQFAEQNLELPVVAQMGEKMLVT